MRHEVLCAAALLFVAATAGCATAPLVGAWQPQPGPSLAGEEVAPLGSAVVIVELRALALDRRAAADWVGRGGPGLQVVHLPRPLLDELLAEVVRTQGRSSVSRHVSRLTLAPGQRREARVVRRHSYVRDFRRAEAAGGALQPVTASFSTGQVWELEASVREAGGGGRRVGLDLRCQLTEQAALDAVTRRHAGRELTVEVPKLTVIRLPLHLNLVDGGVAMVAYPLSPGAKRRSLFLVSARVGAALPG